MKKIQPLLLACALLTATALGRAAVTDENGEIVDPWVGSPGDVVVVFFIGIDCPVSNRYAPTVNELVSTFTRPTVKWYAVYSEPGVKREAIRTHRKAYGYTLPYLVDDHGALAKMMGATVTPEVAVYVLPHPEGAPARKVYLGRIDDRYIAIGKLRTTVTQHDLRDTLEALAAGATPEPRTTQAVGCYLAH